MPNITGLVVIWKCADAGSVAPPDEHTEVLLLCPSLIMIAVFPAALAVGTVLGNLLVILAVVLNSRLARRGTSVLIVNLAIADLLVGKYRINYRVHLRLWLPRPRADPWLVGKSEKNDAIPVHDRETQTLQAWW